MSITEATGSSLIIWFRNKNDGQILVLVGKESNYIEDNSDICRTLSQQGIEIKRAQKFISYGFGNRVRSNSTTSCHCEEYRRATYFRKMSKKIGEILKTEVRYDTPLYNATTKEWTVHYRHLTGPFTRKGIIKGGKCSAEELPLQTIKRECCEELYQCADFPMTYLGVADHYAVFFHQIYHLGHIKNIMWELQKRSVSKYGEMWDFEFVPLHTILENRKEYNKKTVGALELFYKSLPYSTVAAEA